MAHLGFIAGFLFVPLLGSLGVSSGIASAIGGLILAAGSMLLSFLLAPPVPKPDDGHTAVQQTTPFRSFGYGTARTSGAIILKESQHGDTIFEIHAIADHKVSGFQRWYLNEDEVVPWTEEAPPPEMGSQIFRVKHQADGRYGHEIYIQWRYGNDPENVYYSWFDKQGKIPFYTALGEDVWPTTARGDGVASIAMTAADAGADNQQRHYPNGQPIPSCVADFAFLFDPRDVDASGNMRQIPLTWDMTPDQMKAAMATWTFDGSGPGPQPGKNPALAILHWECFSKHGFQRDFYEAMGMARTDKTSPVLDDWRAQANICDESVTTYIDDTTAGTQPRYQLGGWGTTENAAKDVLAFLLATCDGWLVDRGDGTILLRVGKFASSGVTLTDADILGFHYQRGLSDEDSVNRLAVQFTSPDHKYSTVECDAWENEDDQTARGLTRDQQYKLDWVQNYRQARRVAKREFYRLKQPFRGTIDLRLSALNAAYERYIYCACEKYSAFSNVYIETRGATFNLAANAVRIQFVAFDPTELEAWGAVDGSGNPILAEFKKDEGAAPPLLDEISEEDLPVPYSIDISFEKFVLDPGPPVNYGYRMRADYLIADPTGLGDHNVVIQWRVKDLYDTQEGLQPGPWHQEVHNDAIVIGSKFTITTTGAVTMGVWLQVQMASRKNGSNSDWSDPVIEVFAQGT